MSFISLEKVLTHPFVISSRSSGLLISRFVKNSGQAARMVKYMSSFLLHFSMEKLQPRRKVVMRWVSGI